MVGRRNENSPPKIVPKVKLEDEEIIVPKVENVLLVEEIDGYSRIIEQQLQDGNIGGEIEFSMDRGCDIRASVHKEDSSCPEVIIEMENSLPETAESCSSSPRVTVMDIPNQDENATQNNDELPPEISHINGSPSPIPELRRSRTKDENLAQHNGVRSSKTKPVNSHKEETASELEKSRLKKTSESKTKLVNKLISTSQDRLLRGKTRLNKKQPEPSTVDATQKTHACKKCDQMFILKSELDQHRPIHVNEKSFCCEECNYKTDRIGHLTRHMRFHTDEKPFKCSQCSYSALRSSALKAHEITHTSMKRFFCALCGHGTYEKFQLIPHIGRHHGWKPFECKKCDFRFFTKYELKNHVRNHSRKKKYPNKAKNHDNPQSVMPLVKLKPAAHISSRKKVQSDSAPRAVCVDTSSTAIYDGWSYSCKSCRFKATSNYELEEHRQLHLGFLCGLCNFRSLKIDELRNHAMSVHIL